MHEGATILAWQEASVTSAAPAAWQAALDTPATALGEPGARPALLSTEDGLWSAWDTDTGIVWVRLPSGEDVALDLPGFSHSARMAAWQDGVALVTMSIEDGIYNALNLSTVTVDGTVISPGEITSDTTWSAASAPLSVTSTDGRASHAGARSERRQASEGGESGA